MSPIVLVGTIEQSDNLGAHHMKANRRDFLRNLTLGTIGPLVTERSLSGAEPKGGGGFLVKSPSMKIGMVTYELGKDWTIETIIKNCEAAAFQGVELRT